MSVYMTIQTVTGVVGAIVVNQVSRRLGKKTTYCLCNLIYGAILVAMFLSQMKAEQHCSSSVWPSPFFFGSMIGTVVTAMTTDTVIYTMWKDGKMRAALS